MADNRTISQLEAEGYPWIGCEWVPFKMLRERFKPERHARVCSELLDALGPALR